MLSKRCPRCGETKSTEEFSKNRAAHDGLCSYCRPCWSAYHRALGSVGLSVAVVEHPRTPAVVARHRNQSRVAKRDKNHSLEPGRYDRMLDEQGGVCAVCGRPEDTRKLMALAVDHDHRCCPGMFHCAACIRGLLCNRCNRALGMLGDDVERVLALVAYLMKYERSETVA